MIIIFYFVLLTLACGGLSWYLTYEPKLSLDEVTDTLVRCPICFSEFDTSRFFIDCIPMNGSRNNNHNFSIFAGSNFTLTIYLKDFSVQATYNYPNYYVIKIGKKLMEVPPFKVCDAGDVLFKYLKLMSFA